MDIIMLRHGETQDNLKRIFSRDNTKLTEKGKSQILRSKELLKDFKFDDIYYSPLTRTVESKNILGIEGTKESRIREIDFGSFTGNTFDQIQELYPMDSKKWIENPIEFRIPNGESVIDVYSRVESFLNELISKNKNALLVCHDAVIRSMLCWIFEDPEYFLKFKVDNGSINTISVDQGFKYIKRLNYK